MIKHKSGKNISYLYLSLIMIDCLLYIIYGIGFLVDKNLDGIPIILVGIIPFLITLLLVFIKIYFRIIKSCNKKKLKKKNENQENTENEEVIDNL